jgi:DNA repair exonuclease SbcCD ATPase subunit
MKLNTALPWVLAIGLGAGLVALYVKASSKDADLARLREENTELQQIRTELADTKEQSRAQQSEIDSLRKGTQELLSLRNEVGKLRDEKDKLGKQMQAAQTEAQRAQAQAAQARQAELSRGQQLASLQTDVEAMRKSTEQSQQIAQRNMCINNLRQLDGAKQQWALEHGKTADAIPNPQDLAPYLKDNVLPLCPAGGLYTLNAVNQPPVCSTPGHALPK